MITNDAALYASGSSTGLLDGPLDRHAEHTRGTCGCGQELLAADRRHCPRCGCCLA